MECYQPSQDWQAAIIFARRSIEPDFPIQYRGLLPHLHRVYLDELTIEPNQAIGVNIAELVIADEDVAIATAKTLIAQTRQVSVTTGLTLEQVHKLLK